MIPPPALCSTRLYVASRLTKCSPAPLTEFAMVILRFAVSVDVEGTSKRSPSVIETVASASLRLTGRFKKCPAPVSAKTAVLVALPVISGLSKVPLATVGASRTG